jgi:hypothetical protein
MFRTARHKSMLIAFAERALAPCGVGSTGLQIRHDWTSRA